MIDTVGKKRKIARHCVRVPIEREKEKPLEKNREKVVKSERRRKKKF